MQYTIYVYIHILILVEKHMSTILFLKTKDFKENVHKKGNVFRHFRKHKFVYCGNFASASVC